MVTLLVVCASTLCLHTVDRLDFSNETISTPQEMVYLKQDLIAAAVSTSSYGYFGGGFTPPFTNKVDRLDFSNETISGHR